MTSDLAPAVAALLDQPPHVLVADDDAASLLLIKSLLKKQGYQVTTAADGREAVERFLGAGADFVLLDADMPVMDGLEAATRIKLAAGERFVPIIFLTALSDEQALARCIAAGGDDFLTKPYSATILAAKMEALARLGELQTTVRAQRDELAVYRKRTEEEQELAGAILARMLKRWPADLDNVRYLLRPSALLNGDVILLARSPDGRLNAMLGDFTGHGLSAAIGTLPAAELFYEMSAAGYGLADIATALDQRLATLLPAQFFCAAALVGIDPEQGRAAVWNGGLPDLLVVRDNRVIRRCDSRGLPLGIHPTARAEEVTVFDLQPGDRLLLYSDGLTELPAGQARLGQEGLEALLFAGDDPVARIGERVEALAREGCVLDDVALLELRCTGGTPRPAGGRRPGMRAGQWRVVLELGPEVLRQVDPLPPLLGVIEGLQGLGEHRVRIYAVIGELYNNALEHGVLRLESRLKLNAEGFSRYYEERAGRLAALTEGWIRIELSHEPRLGGGRLVIRMEDSGGGFDYEAALACDITGPVPCGRGLKLAREFCDSLTFHGSGSVVEANYSWTGAGSGGS